MRRLPLEGEIILVTKYVYRGLTWGPVWAQVIDGDNDEYGFDFRTIYRAPWSTTNDDNPWTLDKDEDEYRLVGQHQVPGKVWAELAKRALLGEDRDDA